MNRSDSVFARHRAYLLASGALLFAAGVFASSVNAEDFVIAQPVTETNDRNTIDDDDKLTITSTGSITTDGNNEHGVLVGNRNTIVNDGSISTGGSISLGIFANGSGNTITNSGSISTEGLLAEGIRGGDRNIINNSGNISTRGDTATGIDVGDDNKIITSGIISTAERNARGISVVDGNEVNNSGRIGTVGDFAEGIAAADRNKISNSGSISTTGVFADGILVGVGNEIINAGRIDTAGGEARGVDGGTLNRIANTGSISTAGRLAQGIQASDGNIITNSGNISTKGGTADSIDIHDSNIVTNSGNIITTGFGSNGIFASSRNVISNSGSIAATSGIGISVLHNNNVTNSGVISTTERQAAGIASGNGNEISNSGSIRVAGLGSEGIHAVEDNVVTNSGLVVATNGTSFNLGARNTLNLLAPSFIGGEIAFFGASTVNITTGASHSVLWDFFSDSPNRVAPNVTGSVASFFNVGTRQFATLDPTGFAAAYDSLGDMTGQLANVGRQGLSGHLSSGYGAAYGMKDTDSDPAIAYGRGLWVTPFGGKSRHEGDASTLDRDITQAGIAAGYRWQQQPGFGLGVMAGYVSDESEASSRFAKSHDGEADGFFAGLNGRRQWGNLFLDFALMGGVMAHDQDRFVNDNLAALGVSFAKASFDSRFITPEAGLSMSFDAGHGLSITPGARVRYAAQWLDGYTETGSRANASVEDRMLGLVEANAEIAVSQLFGFGSITGRLGILGRSSTGDGEVAVSLIDVSNTVAFSARDDVAGYVGLSASIKADDNLKLDLDGQAIFGEDFTGVQGMARIIQRF